MSVTAHEFGHCLGLADLVSQKAIMNGKTWGSKSRYETYGFTTPQTDDKNGIKHLY